MFEKGGRNRYLIIIFFQASGCVVGQTQREPVYPVLLLNANKIGRELELDVGLRIIQLG